MDGNVTVKITRMMNTSYENGSMWIEYKTSEGHFGYEMLEKDQSFVEVKRKPNLSSCNKVMQELIENCLETENEMWFVEHEDYEDLKEDYSLTDDEINEMILNDIQIFGLQDYIKFDEDGCAITLYGGIITKFEF